MADISVTVIAFAVAGTVSCMLSLHLASAIMCYDCDVLPHQRDCTRVTKCGPDEECYGERVQTPDGLIKFRSGCIKTSKCYFSIGLLPVIGKRSGDTTECSKCCNSSYCNLETCDKPYASLRKRCLSCKYALRPDDCIQSIQCSDGEICYSQTFIHNSERRYRLGCIHREQCGINTIPQVSVGLHQADEYCGQCCEGNNCNRDLCGQRNITHFKLITPPPLTFCRDNSASICAANPSQCSQEYYKFYQCPDTCNQCGVFHYTESVARTTATSITTMQSDLCIDFPGINCAPITCTVASIAKLCKKTCSLCSAVVGIVSCILSLHLASAIMCYDCDELPHQRDCGRVADCGPNMECYGERVQTSDGLIKFRSGCKQTSECYVSIGLLPVIGKRSGETTECSKCCNSSYCNLETCDKPYASNRKRCLSCKYAVRPDECSESIQCRDGEVCYSQTLIHNSERRYRLGCINRQQCGINTISHVSVGIQQADEYCAQCCDGNNCNRDICGQRKVQHYKLITPPPLPFCRDNSTLTCAAKTTQCSQEYYKFYQCPFTCNQCGIYHFTAAVTTTTAIPSSSVQQAVCVDIPGIKCNPRSLICLISSIAKLCKQTCGLCPVGVISTTATLSTSVQTVTSTTATLSTSVQTGCKDPIPDCMCTYLDREVDLCAESERVEDLKRFCCYYCNKQKGIFTCPDVTCLRLEKPEQAEMDKLPKPIDCIFN